MQKPATRAAFLLIAATGLLATLVSAGHSQSSLGIGSNEATLPATGMFAGLLNWINVHQQNFYRSLTGALRSMRDGGGGAWLLVGLSFAYGVFHAAGPGHGKAVISSYMLANEVALRRGILLSFLSALLQSLTAIIIMAAVFLILRGTSVSMTDATRFLEVASYVLVTAFGAWLLWQKAWPRLRALFVGQPAHSLSAASHHEHHHHHDHHACSHGHHHHDHAHDHHQHHGHHHHDDVCPSCGHSHAPDPKLIGGERFDWKTAWTAIIAVGLRPCTGALIVLSFAFLNGLYVAGVLSVLAMGLGTAITVSVLAILAVTAKNWAVAVAGDGRTGNRVHAAIEIAGAAFVFLLGVMLLSASLTA
ncbi:MULTISPECIES: nickel/cobalt transporter [unclassified Aminobacter]|uniref:nickel/cobalt transporter n=1 Tax=unclassified Aminobacter TaxID=2644704 RepID=UPI000467E1B4|nr:MULTISPECIES: nickel/cobalt transporter [unclassified Aminobacter]TWG49391.1 ABC-type nickel/cobalt efflux system permease component RcnA [Aminobacter sp. J44]TWH23440.1 ABC-type nickel/cobalt efflux system permease component RcnA [Aminobacter sp. J15]